MTIYKVVRESWAEPGKYYSALVDGLAIMTYRIGQDAEVPAWLASQGYYATAFKSLEDAKRFAEAAVRSPRIFAAEGEESVELPSRVPIFDVVQGRLDYRLGSDWPPGTVMVKSLRLTDKL
jgi:hypothetical protein